MPCAFAPLVTIDPLLTMTSPFGLCSHAVRAVAVRDERAVVGQRAVAGAQQIGHRAGLRAALLFVPFELCEVIASNTLSLMHKVPKLVAVLASRRNKPLFPAMSSSRDRQHVYCNIDGRALRRPAASMDSTDWPRTSRSVRTAARCCRTRRKPAPGESGHVTPNTIDNARASGVDRKGASERRMNPPGRPHRFILLFSRAVCSTL